VKRHAERSTHARRGATAVAAGLFGCAALCGSILLAAATPAVASGSVPNSSPWTIDWGAGITFGAVDNVGPHAIADCTIASVAAIEQVFEHQPTPPNPRPYVAAYDALARAGGESPGPNAGLVPSAVLAAWRKTGIAGSKISEAAPLPVSQSRV
jgi:hypothetical protein